MVFTSSPVQMRGSAVVGVRAGVCVVPPGVGDALGGVVALPGLVGSVSPVPGEEGPGGVVLPVSGEEEGSEGVVLSVSGEEGPGGVVLFVSGLAVLSDGAGVLPESGETEVDACGLPASDGSGVVLEGDATATVALSFVFLVFQFPLFFTR